LHKLYLQPPSRYSEDIDLVQISPAPAGPLIKGVHETLNPFLGEPHLKQAHRSVTLTYRVESEIPPVQSLKLKIEVNTREHFSMYGLTDFPFEIQSQWFSGKCSIKTYLLNELLGTKLRALYRRRKGRDLYDIWLGLTKGKADPAQIVESFKKYMNEEGHRVSQKDYRANLANKMEREDFLSDTISLLTTEVQYEPQAAYTMIDKQILQLLD
jgi:predicted nucleotidyltransferase component of viral defense system